MIIAIEMQLKFRHVVIPVSLNKIMKIRPCLLVTLAAMTQACTQGLNIRIILLVVSGKDKHF